MTGFHRSVKRAKGKGGAIPTSGCRMGCSSYRGAGKTIKNN